MTTYDGRLRLGLFGPFTLIDADGECRAPKGAKAQALIAMIATSETGRLGRIWLQNKLWANSEQNRASVSLRQALSEVRGALGPAREVLIADRRSVSLDWSVIDLAPRQGDQDFLEGSGLGDRDHVLAKWLDRERSATQAGPIESCLAKPVSRDIYRSGRRA